MSESSCIMIKKNKHNIIIFCQVHFPEKSDSVLSRVILSIINTESAEYMVYFSDFLNAKNIADIKQIPMRSQWMHVRIFQNLMLFFFSFLLVFAPTLSVFFLYQHFM